MDGKQIIKRRVKSGDVDQKMDSTYVPLYAQGWKQPQSISLRQFLAMIAENLDDVVIEMKYPDKEEKKPALPAPPEGTKLLEAGFAIDDNFLYVYVDGGWRRTPCVGI